METIFKSDKTELSKVSKIWQVEVLPFVPVISIFILLFIFKNSSMSEEILDKQSEQLEAVAESSDEEILDEAKAKVKEEDDMEDDIDEDVDQNELAALKGNKVMESKIRNKK